MNDKEVALITGSTRGIGLGIAIELAKAGFDIVCSGTRDAESAKDSVEKLEELGAKVLYCQCNVSDKKQRSAMLENIKAEFGRLDVLVNNAGIAPKVRADILDASEESFELLMKVNLQGPYFLTQKVAQWMIEQKKENEKFFGRIINVSSISSTVASVSRGEYCISKAGVSMATKLWAARLGDEGIAVYEIRPGVIKTDMTSTVTEKYDKLISEGLCVQSRWGFPEDIGRAAASLAKGDFAYSTGQVILVDGGMTLPRL